VEVALEPPPLGVAGLDDAGARGAQIAQLGECLGLESLVVDGETRRGADRPLEVGGVERPGVMGHEGDPPSVAQERRQRPSTAGFRGIDRSPGGVDVAPRTTVVRDGRR
jgi:hypothetical protein